jgi:hypothetical protein
MEKRAGTILTVFTMVWLFRVSCVAAPVSADIKMFCRTRCVNDYRGFDACFEQCISEKTATGIVEFGDAQASDPNAVGTDPGRGHTITVGGRYFFPIGLYNIFPEDMAQVQAAGFNLVHAHTSCCNEDELEMHEHFLSEAERTGMKVFLMPVFPPNRLEGADPENLRLLSRAVQRRAQSPALMFWFLFPRPRFEEDISAEAVGDIRFFTSENDPNHPLVAAVSQEKSIMDYMPAGNWIMVAPFPLPYYPIDMVRNQVRSAVAAAAGQRPVLAMLQAHYDTGVFPLEFGNVRPSEEELYNMAHQAVANGAKGLVFWDVHGEKIDVLRHPGAWPALRRVATDLSAHSFIYVMKDSLRKVALSPQNAPVDLLLKEDDTDYYLLAVNHGRRHLDIQINLSGLDLASVEPMPHYLRPDLYVAPPTEQQDFGQSDIVPLQSYTRMYEEKDTGLRHRMRKFNFSGGVLSFEMQPIDVWWFRIAKPETPADRYSE